MRWQWRVHDKLPNKIDTICLITYGCTNKGLTQGSQRTLDLAMEIAHAHPNTVILWGVFGKNTHIREVEISLRSSLLRTTRNTFVGDVTSTTDECMTMLKYIKEDATIVVVAEGAHSRRTRVVWRYLGGRRKIFIQSIRCRDAADTANPMILQRKWWVWLMVNTILLPLYKFFPGVSWFARRNFSQPT